MKNINTYRGNNEVQQELDSYREAIISILPANFEEDYKAFKENITLRIENILDMTEKDVDTELGKYFQEHGLLSLKNLAEIERQNLEYSRMGTLAMSAELDKAMKVWKAGKITDAASVLGGGYEVGDSDTHFDYIYAGNNQFFNLGKVANGAYFEEETIAA